MIDQTKSSKWHWDWNGNNVTFFPNLSIHWVHMNDFKVLMKSSRAFIPYLYSLNLSYISNLFIFPIPRKYLIEKR